MKNCIKVFGIIALLAVVTLSLISCAENMAELKIKNDTSSTYTIRVKINDETVYDGQMSPGGTRSHSRSSGFSFRVYATKGSYVNDWTTGYSSGDVSPGNVEEVLLSQWAIDGFY